MKKYKHIIFTISLFLICMTNTYAACTKEEINDFKRIEDEYTIKYKFNKSTKDYTVTFNIPMIEKYTYSLDNIIEKAKFVSETETSFTFSDIKPGEYPINVVGVSSECDDILKTINLKLAKYNKYSEDPICEGIEEFVLCQETYDKEIDYDTFVSRVNTYKKSKEKQENNKVEEKPKEENKVLKYIEDNLIQIIIVTIFIILVLITAHITFKSIRKSRRLE